MGIPTRRAIDIAASWALFVATVCILWFGSRQVRLIGLPVVAAGYVALWIAYERRAKRHRKAD